MKDRRDREHNPALGVGAFLVAFGLFMAVIMFDLLGLGDPGEYMMWQILILFIGTISLFKGKVVGALILGIVGSYFLLPELNIELPELIETIYWPAAIVIAGVALVISGIFRRSHRFK